MFSKSANSPAGGYYCSLCLNSTQYIAGNREEETVHRVKQLILT